MIRNMESLYKKYQNFRWKIFVITIIIMLIGYLAMYIDYKFGFGWFDDNVFLK